MAERKVISLLDRLPPKQASEMTILDGHIAPFLTDEMDCFERWLELANYAALNPPLSREEKAALRERWGR